MKKLGIMQALLLSSLSMGLMVNLQSRILKQTKVERYLKADRANRAREARAHYAPREARAHYAPREARAHYALFLNLKREIEHFNKDDNDNNVHDLNSRVMILNGLKKLTSKANLLIEQNNNRNILPALNEQDLALLSGIGSRYQKKYENFLDEAKDATFLAFVILDPENEKLTEEELKKKLHGIPFYHEDRDKESIYTDTIPLILGTIDLLKQHARLFNMYKNNDLFTISEAQLKKVLHDHKPQISSEQNI